MALKEGYSKVKRTGCKEAQNGTDRICIVLTKNANINLLVSCLVHNLRERGDRDLVAEEHLQHDLSSFTCCLSDILKGRKAAA